MFKNCFIFLTYNINNEYILKLLKHYYNELKDVIDFYVLLDNKKCNNNLDLLDDIPYYIVNNNNAQKIKWFHNEIRSIDGYILDFFETHKLYDNYYVCEDDVLYLGSIAEFIKKYDDVNVDVLLENCTIYHPYATNVKYMENGMMNLYTSDYIDRTKPTITCDDEFSIEEFYYKGHSIDEFPYKNIFLIYRVSYDFLNTYYDECVNKTLQGFFEWTYTACLLNHNFTYKIMDEITYFVTCLVNNFKEKEKNNKNIFIHHKNAIKLLS